MTPQKPPTSGAIPPWEPRSRPLHQHLRRVLRQLNSPSPDRNPTQDSEQNRRTTTSNQQHRIQDTTPTTTTATATTRRGPRRPHRYRHSCQFPRENHSSNNNTVTTILMFKIIDIISLLFLLWFIHKIPTTSAFNTCKVSIDTVHFENNLNAIIVAARKLALIKYSPIDDPLGEFYDMMAEKISVSSYIDLKEKTNACQNKGRIFQPSNINELTKMILLVKIHGVIFPIDKRDNTYFSNNFEIRPINSALDKSFTHVTVKLENNKLTSLGLDSSEPTFTTNTVLICLHPIPLDDSRAIGLTANKMELVHARTTLFQNLTKQFHDIGFNFSFDVKTQTVSLPSEENKDCFPFSWELFKFEPIEIPAYCTPDTFITVMKGFEQIIKVFHSISAALAAAQKSGFRWLTVVKKAETFTEFLSTLFNGDYTSLTVLSLLLTLLLLFCCCLFCLCCGRKLVVVASTRRDGRILSATTAEMDTML